MPIAWRPSGIQRGESLWSLLTTFSYLNRPKRRELDMLFGRSEAQDPLSSKRNDLSGLAGFSRSRLIQLLQLTPAALGEATIFAYIPQCLPFRRQELGGVSSGVLRYCPRCLELGYHTPLFQLLWVTECPVHGVSLASHCPRCACPIPYRLTSELLGSPGHCECGHALLPLQPSGEGKRRELERIVTLGLDWGIRLRRRVSAEHAEFGLSLFEQGGRAQLARIVDHLGTLEAPPGGGGEEAPCGHLYRRERYPWRLRNVALCFDADKAAMSQLAFGLSDAQLTIAEALHDAAWLQHRSVRERLFRAIGGPPRRMLQDYPSARRGSATKRRRSAEPFLWAVDLWAFWWSSDLLPQPNQRRRFEYPALAQHKFRFARAFASAFELGSRREQSLREAIDFGRWVTRRLVDAYCWASLGEALPLGAKAAAGSHSLVRYRLNLCQTAPFFIVEQPVGEPPILHWWARAFSIDGLDARLTQPATL